MVKKDPKESRPLMLRELAKAHGCVPDKVVEAFIEVYPGSKPAPRPRSKSGACSAQLCAQALRASCALQGGKAVARGHLLITLRYVNFRHTWGMQLHLLAYWKAYCKRMGALRSLLEAIQLLTETDF